MPCTSCHRQNEGGWMIGIMEDRVGACYEEGARGSGFASLSARVVRGKERIRERVVPPDYALTMVDALG